MAGDIDVLKTKLKRWTLLLGVLQITVGCIVGFIPPSAVQWFRGIVMAHIEFTANGVLMVAFGFLVHELGLNSAALKVWFAALQIVGGQGSGFALGGEGFSGKGFGLGGFVGAGCWVVGGCVDVEGGGFVVVVGLVRSAPGFRSAAGGVVPGV